MFLGALAPVVEAGSFIEWEGEESEDFYRHDFDGERMKLSYGRIVWDLQDDDATDDEKAETDN